jgi:polyphosphate glucokinase
MAHAIGSGAVIERRVNRRPMGSTSRPRTLAIDIGGSHIKASVLDKSGTEMTQHVAVTTPHPAPPESALALIEQMVRKLPAFDRVSVGFPGVVRDGRVFTAPNLGTIDWRDFPLAAELTRRWGKPARALNDAEVQGLGVIEGKGLECVLTLGTGFGSALYRDGELMPHLELGQHPVWKSDTYDQYVGELALEHKGMVKWNRRVRHVIDTVRTLLNYDHLYLGGGNAKRIDFELPADVTIVSNEAGITGGIRLWDAALDRFFSKR